MASCALALRLALQSHVIALVGHPGVLDIPGQTFLSSYTLVQLI